MISQDKTIQIWNRYREIQRKLKEAEMALSQWAHEARSLFGGGKAGDAEFAAWCQQHGGLNRYAVDDLLLRATAASIVPDKPTWDAVGGLTNIRRLESIPLRRDRVAVLEAAKATGRTVITVMKERGLWATNSAPKTKPVGAPTQTEPTLFNEVRETAVADAITLARFVASHRGKLAIPPDIRDLLERYIVRLKAA